MKKIIIGKTMKYNHIKAILACWMFASCSQDINISDTTITDSDLITITFSTEMEAVGANTRTILSPDNMIRWEEGDQAVLITDRLEVSMNGSTNPTTGQYEFSTPYYDKAHGIVGYPQNGVTRDNESYDRLVLNYPTFQTATPNSFDKNAGIMLANATRGNVLHFYNQFALLKFIPEVDCRQVIICGVYTGKTSGHMYSGIDEVFRPYIDFYNNYVVLSGDIIAGNTYFIAVAPQEEVNGLKLTLTTRDNKVYTKESSQSTDLPRNTILNLGVVRLADMVETTPDFNGHEAIDLGMVIDGGKKVYYGTKNLGAATPVDHGDYYGWGETELRYTSINEDGTINYKKGVIPFERKNYINYKRFIEGYSDLYHTWYYTMQPEDDAAHVHWGGKWKIPNPAHLQFTTINCTITQEMRSGVGVSYYKYSGIAGFEDQTMIIPYVTGYITNNLWHPNYFKLMTDMIVNVYEIGAVGSETDCDIYELTAPTKVSQIRYYDFGYAIRPVWVE